MCPLLIEVIMLNLKSTTPCKRCQGSGLTWLSSLGEYQPATAEETRGSSETRTWTKVDCPFCEDGYKITHSIDISDL